MSDAPPPPPSGPSGPVPPPPTAVTPATPTSPPPPEVPPPPARPSRPGPEPLVPDGDQALAPRVVLLWRAASTVPFLVLMLPALIVPTAFGGLAWLAPLVVLVVAGLVVGLVPPARHRRWRWRMTGQALELEHGILFRTVRALPYFRIQHIDLDHGPLDRRLGLARLQVHTASVTATLPGLPADDAPRVRAALLAFADAEVGGDRGTDAV